MLIAMAFVFRDLFPDERSYRPGEVAQRFGVHVDTIRRWTNEGKISCIRICGHRRIPFDAIQRFADQYLHFQANK